MVASRPTTRPVASIITHFFSTSAGFAENVFMAWLPSGAGPRRRVIHRRPAPRPPPPLKKSAIKTISYSYGFIITRNKSRAPRRNRIGRGDVGDGIVVPVGANGDFPRRKLLPELQKSRFSGEVALGGLAQEIDVEVDGDRERHRPNGGKDRDIHGEI